MANPKTINMNIRSKDHPFWRIVFFIAKAIDTAITGIIAFIHAIFGIVYWLLILIFISQAKPGTMEIRED